MITFTFDGQTFEFHNVEFTMPPLQFEDDLEKLERVVRQYSARGWKVRKRVDDMTQFEFHGPHGEKVLGTPHPDPRMAFTNALKRVMRR